MATGITARTSFSEAVPIINHAARSRGEFPFVSHKLTDMQKLGPNEGDKWRELLFGQLTAQSIGAHDVLDSFQDLGGESVIEIEPAYSGIATKVTNAAYKRLSSVAVAQIGNRTGDALMRKLNDDTIAVFDTATSTLGTAGNVGTYGLVAAGVSRVRTGDKSTSSTTHEPWTGPIVAVMNSYQVKHIQDEVTAGIGTYTVPTGMTEDYFKRGITDMTVAGASIAVDDNIPIDSSSDARGAIFAQGKDGAIVTVEEEGLKTYSRFDPSYGGGADEIFTYKSWQHGERGGGIWMFKYVTDSTPPTS